MADPFSISISLQQAKCALDAMKFYQRMTNDLTMDVFITSLQAQIVSNNPVGNTISGYSSVLAQSATGVTGSAS